MAIIDGKQPKAPPLPKPAFRRVAVKLKPDHGLPYTLAAHDIHAARNPQAWKALSTQFGDLRLTPYFARVGEPALRGLEAASVRTGRSSGETLSTFYAVEVPAGQDAEAVAKAIAAWPDVDSAQVDAEPAPPPVQPDDDPLFGDQGYLEAAPEGIGAHIAWSLCTGKGIGFAGVEQGWTLNHEDLVAANIPLISGVNNLFNGHGTAVLGEVLAIDNTLGGIGIAPDCIPRVVSQWHTANDFNTAGAIVAAATSLNAGDVMLIEAQITNPNASGFMPVEVEDPTFFAIQAAVAKGVIVVEAAGNGSVDLDQFKNTFGKFIFKRNSPDFRDSGAIMVGAGSSATPHARLSFSNFGSRIDCYGWGENITTSGDGFAGNDPHAYTNSFGGTSGASPMVTGAALLVQSWCKAHSTLRTPAQMRTLLSDPLLNTTSADPPNDRIGVMPDLHAVLRSLGAFFPSDLRVDVNRWAAVVTILFGVIQDGGGFVFKPGGGGPIGPWGPDGPVWLGPEQRNILLGLAVTELARLTPDADARKAMEQSGIAAIRAAADRLAGRAGGLGETVIPERFG